MKIFYEGSMSNELFYYISKQQYDVYNKYKIMLAEVKDVVRRQKGEKEPWKWNSIGLINTDLVFRFTEDNKLELYYNNTYLGNFSRYRFKTDDVRFKIPEEDKYLDFMKKYKYYELRYNEGSDGVVEWVTVKAYDLESFKILNEFSNNSIVYN